MSVLSLKSTFIVIKIGFKTGKSGIKIVFFTHGKLVFCL